MFVDTYLVFISYLSRNGGAHSHLNLQDITVTYKHEILLTHILPHPRFYTAKYPVRVNTMQTGQSSSDAGSEEFAVIGVLGGPGSGKGTQCTLLAQTFKLNHISIGDVMRQEMKREGSEYASIIEQNMRAGTVAPKEITIPILKSHMLAASCQGADLFILDGMCVINLPLSGLSYYSRHFGTRL